jgi:hypothetical protein
LGIGVQPDPRTPVVVASRVIIIGSNDGPLILGHQGTAVQEGSGAAGQVTVTLTTTTPTLTASIAESAELTRMARPTQPGSWAACPRVEPESSPQIPEVWHSLTLQSGFTAGSPAQ